MRIKIAVSGTGPTLDSEVDPRFGRCQHLIFVDTDTMEFESQNNTANSSGGGAGIATGQMVLNRNVEAVLTGNVGPKAHKVLSEAGIRIVTGVSGTVRQAIYAFKKGELKETSGPTVNEHAGIQSSQ